MWRSDQSNRPAVTDQISRSNHKFSNAAAEIHLVFDALNWRPRVVPREPVRSAFFQTLKQFFLKKGTNVMHRVYFAYRDIVPAHAESSQSPFHQSHYEVRFLLNCSRAGLSPPYHIMRIERTFRQLACSRNHKRLPQRLRWNGVGEAIERGLRGRVHLRRNVRTRHRVHTVNENVPLLEDINVACVELIEAGEAEWLRRPQL